MRCMFFDTHVHLDGFAADGSLDAVLQAAADAGVHRMCAVGNDPENNTFVLRLATEHPDVLFAAVGFDRDQAEAKHDETALCEQAADARVAAIGEIGLDYFYAPETAKAQRALFSRMLELALAVGKPVIVHTRDADADTLAMLREFTTEWRARFAAPPGVLHCFTRDGAMADSLLEMGLLLSFSGIVTFRNAAPLRAIAGGIPLERLLIETDCPYLTPIPFRGERNEPRLVEYVARCLAEIRGVSVEEIARQTNENAMRVFAQRLEEKEVS